MRFRTKVITLTLVAIVITIGATLFFMHYYPLSDKTYSGKELFETEEEYAAFKELVGNDNVRLNEATVLSSDAPIVVTFRVRVPYDFDFTYGSVIQHTGIYLLAFAWPILILILFMVVDSIPTKKEDT